MKVLASVFTDEPVSVVRPVTEMLIGLHNLGVNIDIVTNADTFYAKKFETVGMKVYDFYPTKKIDLSAIRKHRALIKQGKYDIFQSFENKGMATGNFACAGLPIINIGYKGIGFQWHDPTYMLTMNTPLMDYLICLSDTVERNIKPQLFFQKPKTHRIYKGQDLRWFAQEEEPIDLTTFGVPKDAFVVLNVSTIRKVKGVDYLVDAWNYLPKESPIHLVHIGHNEEPETYKKLIAENKNSEKIHFLGKKQQVNPFLKAADMFVLPTAGLEGLSRALMEAMSMALPVLVTKSGGPEELVVHGESGEHIPQKDAEAIVQGIMDYYKNSEKRALYGKAAKQRIEKEFSMETYIQNMYGFYQSVLATR